MAFALDVFIEGVDLVMAGAILMIVGVVGLTVSMFTGGFGGFRTERHVSADGRHVVEETRETL